MNKSKIFSPKFFAALVAFAVLASSLNLMIYAVPEQTKNLMPVILANNNSTLALADSNVMSNEDSTFTLTNTNVSPADEDYYPETANILEQDEYNSNTDPEFNRNTEPKSNLTTTIQAASMTLGDPMVYLTQKWLNQQYGAVPGYGVVEVDGKTGYDVIYGLLRALQHELGITTLVNSFGPTTSSLYSQNLLQRQDGVTNRKFAILQAALWCKGYNPGYYLTEDPNTGIVSFQEVFNATVENAVIQLKTDAGFISPNGVVTLNVMKALMSMDSFKLLDSYYGGKSQIRIMQQNLNRNYEAYTGLNPCDGVYGRSTNKAFIYAFQAEEGLPIGVANGSFGPTTSSLCPQIPYIISATAAKSYQGNYYTNTQILIFTQFLQFALFINGFGDGTTDGVFGSATQQNINNFQQHYALPLTGKADLTNWMSLLISSGNPTRPALAGDCATILNAAKAKTLYDNGYQYIGRYLTGTYNGGISKAMTPAEANIILNAGLRFFPIYQESSNTVSYFTAERGTIDANAAIAAATALGLPGDTIIYFAVDFDAMDYQITSNVIPYFSKVNERMSASIYKTGIYGARNVCSRVAAAGYSYSSFVGDMSTGFSGNLGFKIPNDWAFSQFANLEGINALGTGDGRIEIDKNAFSGRDQGVSRLVSGIDLVKKAIYVLPGYLGSELYDGADGTNSTKRLWFPDNILDLDTVLGQNNLMKFYQDENSSGTQLHVDNVLDNYGVMDIYKVLVDRLKNDFSDNYDVIFFPFNWLEDINDSEIKLENDIKNKGYSEVVFVTHSTGGLLASAYISKSSENKLKVKKAILIAAPLFGTYASILPLERGDGRKTANLFTKDFWIDTLTDNSWIRRWAKNSPTTYQLLPSSEYLQYLPLQDKRGWGDGEEAISSIDGYYSVLNQSNNINPKLTNGSNRSHKYFRETVLKEDVVKTLREVDTLMIGTASGHSTTSATIYNETLIGTKKQLKDIQYNKNGDGTVQGFSSKGEAKGSTTLLRNDFSFTSNHSDLVKDPLVLGKITEEINGLNNDATKSYSVLSISSEMSGFIKIQYEANLPITATLYDSLNTIVAQASGDANTGFDDENFIYDSFADNADVTEASIYMPNSGYKIVFTHGNGTGVNVNFNAEVSTLDNDGLKDISVTSFVEQTLTNGIVSSIDGTINIIDNVNIANIINGTAEIHFTDWELPNIIKLNRNNVLTVNIIGSEAVQASLLLHWTSANESIATVSQTGVITAVGYGKTTIATTDGNKSATCEIVVMQNATTVNFANVDMLIGERMVINPDFAPVTSTETALNYTYDKASIISIDEFGVIHALAAGTVTVNSTTDYGVFSSFIVTVTDPDFITRGDINNDGEIDISDLASIKKHILKTELLTNNGLLAMDMNKDTNVSISDLLMLKKILLGITSV